MTEETTTTLDDALAGETTQPQPEPTTQETPAEPVTEETKPAETGGVDNDDGQIKVPLAALHEVRDANRALKQEMEALKATAQPAPEPEKIPDMFGDPEGYAAYQQRLVTGAVQQATQAMESRILNMSEANATRNHGAEAVEAAKQWALSQPAAVQAEIVGQSDPYDYAVQQHKRQSLTEQLTADPDKLDRVLKLLEGKTQAEPPKAPPINTAVDQSVGARQAQWAGPTSLDDIFSN